MKKVTLIVPVYNSEKYIGKCLDSILNQTYKNIEILVVNDGSKDNSQKIIDEFQSKYPDKIIAINQENKGVSKTRNESIKKASGDYIMFIDNDDYLDSDYIETFVTEAEKGDYDVVLGGYRRPNENGKIIKEMKLKETEWSKFMILAPWAKIYKKQYLNRRVSRPLSDMIENRTSKIAEGKEVLEIVDGETTERSFVMIPIISNGDSLGAVILVGTEEDELVNELDINSAKIATSFLGKYLEG